MQNSILHEHNMFGTRLNLCISILCSLLLLPRCTLDPDHDCPALPCLLARSSPQPNAKNHLMYVPVCHHLIHLQLNYTTTASHLAPVMACASTIVVLDQLFWAITMTPPFLLHPIYFPTVWSVAPSLGKQPPLLIFLSLTNIGKFSNPEP